MPVNNQTGIKSIQRGLMTIASQATTTTATISAVDTNKAVIAWNGQSMGGTGNSISARLWLNSSTQIGAARFLAVGLETKIAYEITEFF